MLFRSGGGGGGGIATISGTAPITIDYTDPEDPVIGVSTALPTSVGTVYALTPDTSDSTTIFGYGGGGASSGERSTLIGYMAGAEFSGSSTCTNDNIALGYMAMLNPDTLSCCNIAIGCRALGGGGDTGLTGNNNIAIGITAGINMVNSSRNTVIGHTAGCQLVCSNNNVIVGYNAGNDGFNTNNSVVVGTNVSVAIPGANCQLAIGYDSGCYWLTGNSTKAIKPGAGIIDCAGSCGTSGQVLVSTGSNAVCWGSPPPSQAYPVIYKSTGSVTTSGSYGSATVIYDTPILTNSAATYTNANGRLTPQLAGVWVITATARSYDDPNTESAVSIVFNDTTTLAGAGSIGQVAATITGMEVFNGTTDYVRVRITTQTGATNSQNGNRLTAYYLGPAA